MKIAPTYDSGSPPKIALRDLVIWSPPSDMVVVSSARWIHDARGTRPGRDMGSNREAPKDIEPLAFVPCVMLSRFSPYSSACRPTRARRPFDASVDPTEARNEILGCFGRSNRNAHKGWNRGIEDYAEVGA
jgi:hypothetical protein